MAIQYFDDVLYTPFRATIRGEYYGMISERDMDEECYNLALRAIATFKFPKISTEYVSFYAIRTADNTLQEVSVDELNDYPDAALHAYFVNELTFAEIQVLIA